MYNYDMRLNDVFHILLKAYLEAIAMPEFEMSKGGDYIERVMFAPINGSFSIEPFGPSSLDTKYSIEQFYSAMVKTMLTELMLSRIDWLRNKGIETLPAPVPSTTRAESPLWVLGANYRLG
jgi:hypothetical protein